MAYDNLHQGREASPEGAIEKIVDRLMDFANDESPSPPWVCFYDEVFKLPPGATVERNAESGSLEESGRVEGAERNPWR